MFSDPLMRDLGGNACYRVAVNRRCRFPVDLSTIANP